MDGLTALGDQLEDKVKDLLEFHQKKKDLYSLPDASLVAGVKRWFSARETAKFFGRSSTWIYNRIDKNLFTDEKGIPLEFKTVGEGPRPRMRFDLEVIREMALSCYRDGIVGIDELKVIYRRLAESEFEEKLDEPDFQ